MTTPAQIAAELEALASTIRSTPDYIQTPDAIAVGAEVIPHLPTIISALKAMEEQTDGE